MDKREPNTKQRIIDEALHLFSVKGYESVTVAEIAEAVGIKAPSLYKHYKSKKDIYDAIIVEMNQRYQNQMSSMQISGKDAEKDKNYYKNITEDELVTFGLHLFKYFLHDEYACKFRRMLTLSQFTNTSLCDTFVQKYFYVPLHYQEQSFRLLVDAHILAAEDPRIMALQYYAPMFLLITLCDRHPEMEPEALKLKEQHIRQFIQIYRNTTKQKSEEFK